jgi:hypothetical protein
LTDADDRRMEAALGIVLPEAYRRLVVPFPVPAYVGNAEMELWDDAERLISLNRELRGGLAFVKPWPPHMFAMGRDHGGCASAIDLQSPTNFIWWADRCHLDPVGSGPFPSIEEWANRYVGELRSDLEGDCVDPDGSPESRIKAVEEGGPGCWFLLALIGIGILIVVSVLLGAVWWYKP